MLSSIPPNELVHLNIAYEINTGDRAIVTPSPLSRPLPLRQAIEEAVRYVGTGARVSITVRGLTYSDEAEFMNIWSRGFDPEEP